MARNFNGGTDRIAHTGGFVDAVGKMVVSFWMKTTQTTANAQLCARWNGSSRNGWGLILNNSAGKVLSIAYETSAQTVAIAGTTTVNDGAWHNVIAMYNIVNANANYLYVDGVLQGSVNSSGFWTCGSGNYMQWGDSYDTFWPTYVGDIAEAGYWDGIHLDAAQIAALAAGASPRQIALQNLDYYAPFVRSENDRFGSVIGGSGFSGTTVSDHPRALGGLP